MELWSSRWAVCVIGLPQMKYCVSWIKRERRGDILRGCSHTTKEWMNQTEVSRGVCVVKVNNSWRTTLYTWWEALSGCIVALLHSIVFINCLIYTPVGPKKYNTPGYTGNIGAVSKDPAMADFAFSFSLKTVKNPSMHPVSLDKCDEHPKQ